MRREDFDIDKHEMCYVIIGCLQQDHKFNDFPTIDTQDMMQMKPL